MRPNSTCAKFLSRMKRILKTILVTGATLWLLQRYYSGVTIKDIETLILATIALILANLLVRPLIKLITLPLNLLTLGFFSWFANIFTFYLVVRIVSGFSLSTTYFPGFSWGNVSIAPTELSRFATLVIATFLFSFIYRFLVWLLNT